MLRDTVWMDQPCIFSLGQNHNKPLKKAVVAVFTLFNIKRRKREWQSDERELRLKERKEGALCTELVKAKAKLSPLMKYYKTGKAWAFKTHSSGISSWEIVYADYTVYHISFLFIYCCLFICAGHTFVFHSRLLFIFIIVHLHNNDVGLYVFAALGQASSS